VRIGEQLHNKIGLVDWDLYVSNINPDGRRRPSIELHLDSNTARWIADNLPKNDATVTYLRKAADEYEKLVLEWMKT